MDNHFAFNRISAMSAAERQEEERRQVQVLADAIQAAINETSMQFDVPILNAVAGAIVTIEASMLASVSPEHRKMLRKSMEKARPGALTIALSKNPTRAPTIMVRRHDS